MSRLVISLLGPLRVTLDGDPVTGFESDKVRALLAYLAVEAQVPHRREKLAGLLWPDQPETVARANLRHVLARLRKALGDRAPAKDGARSSDRAPSPPFLHVTRQTIQFNSASDARVDVSAFTSLLQTKPPENGQFIHQLEEAIELVHGAFLEGFSLPGCPAFEEWALFEGERLQRLAMDALERLRDWHEKQGNVERALEYAWRQVELEPWREEAHQQVMRLLALDGQRSAALAQYETCRRLLVEELGVEPGAETTQLYEQIRDGELEAPAPHSERERLTRLPGFLADDADEAQPPVFVARERQLARLEGLLETAMAGHGRVVFVTGGPGRGKTALLDEFARRAMEAQPDLLVASGNCNAYSGIGDPYLPFRDVMGMLTGDVEAKWAAGAIRRDHARRLWGALPLAVQALVDHGPHVVPALVPGAALLSRALAVAPPGAHWLQRLRERVERRPVQSEGLEQSSLFQQVSNVLHNLAEARPLLLVLDDLQWADSASVGLLFHLSRRLEGNRILIAGAYRPEEIALDHGGARPGPPARSNAQGRHPLEKLLAEFKRRFGDVWLDLAEVQEPEGRQFVDALLATQPNRLGEDFRRELFAHSGGHPLFTVELLRAMQERGDLVQDGAGYWMPGPALDWEMLPPRVEGVIEARIGRLDEQLRELLSVACVEGEEFTAEVVAQVLKVGEPQVLRRLARELDKRHHLVREQSALRVDSQRLSRYRFSHALFQQYLYNDLSDGERALLHGEIAKALDELYQGYPEEVVAIAPQLAHHYSEAGDERRTLKYLILAGDGAQASYANAEALDYYSRALELAYDDAACYALLSKMERVYDLLGAQEERARAIAALEALAEALDTAEEQAGRSRRAEAALRRAAYERLTGNNVAAFAAVRAADRLAREAQDLRCEADARREWGHLLSSQGEYESARHQFERAVTLARECGARRVEAGSLSGLGWVFWHQGILHPGARTDRFFEGALDLYRKSGDRQGEAGALISLGVLCVGVGDLPQARVYYERARGIYREIGNLPGEATPLANIAWVYWGEDDYAGARASLEQALAISREAGLVLGEAHCLTAIGETMAAQGDYTLGEACCREALRLSREHRDRRLEARALLALGLIHYYQGDYAQAGVLIEESWHLSHDHGSRWVESKGLAALGLVRHTEGDDEAARDHAQQALENKPPRYPLGQGDSALVLGHALAGLGDLAGAAAAYQQALKCYHQSGFRNPPAEALAGLARLALAGGEPSQAMAHVNEILEHLRAHSLDGTYEPFRIYWTCHQVLKANADARAAEVLRTACRLLQERAAGIEDERLRRAFLENVPANRKLIQECPAVK